MGIDTWGVDYVLLDQAGQVLGDTVAYRDSRTQGMDAKLEQTMPFTELYRRTGIAKQPSTPYTSSWPRRGNSWTRRRIFS